VNELERELVRAAERIADYRRELPAARVTAELDRAATADALDPTLP
jgi:predicted dithiol-disulfide oxidoreductase (DUF899 family)